MIDGNAMVEEIKKDIGRGVNDTSVGFQREM